MLRVFISPNAYNLRLGLDDLNCVVKAILFVVFNVVFSSILGFVVTVVTSFVGVGENGLVVTSSRLKVVGLDGVVVRKGFFVLFGGLVLITGGFFVLFGGFGVVVFLSPVVGTLRFSTIKTNYCSCIMS